MPDYHSGPTPYTVNETRPDDAADRWATVADRHVQCIDHQTGISPRVDRPADDSSAERSQDPTAVQPPFAGAVLRDVRNSQLIWGQSMKLAIDQIVSRGDPAEPFDPNRTGQSVDTGAGHQD